jgi:hypothetical protein
VRRVFSAFGGIKRGKLGHGIMRGIWVKQLRMDYERRKGKITWKMF